VSRAPWTTFKGETRVSYIETTYYIVPSLVDDLTTSIQKAYGDLPQGCYAAISRPKGAMKKPYKHC